MTYVPSAPLARLDIKPTSVPVAGQPRNLNSVTHSSIPFTIRAHSGWSGLVKARLYAGVSVNVFHHVLRAPWPWFQEAFNKGNPFGSEGCLGLGEIQENHLDPGQDWDLEFRGGSSEPLGPSPRQRYPFVICLVPSGAEDNAVGALLYVIHVKDEVCRIPTQVLLHYLKLKSGTAHQMQSLYIPERDSDANVSLCVVCQELQATRAILPCRHACTCQKCFDKLRRRCPMCRTAIQAYFLVSEELEVVEELEETKPNLTWRQRLSHWNDAFAVYMGLNYEN